MEHQNLEQCKRRLRESGSRITKGRLAVWKVLMGQGAPLSPVEIHERIEKDRLLTNIDPVSIYRILEAFLELELVHKVGPMGGFVACSHVDCPKGLHILTRCSACLKIREWDAPQSLMAPMLWYLKEQKGFLPNGHLIEVDGQCLDCQKISKDNCN